jgi:hypothetical protein
MLAGEPVRSVPCSFLNLDGKQVRVQFCAKAICLQDLNSSNEGVAGKYCFLEMWIRTNLDFKEVVGIREVRWMSQTRHQFTLEIVLVGSSDRRTIS